MNIYKILRKTAEYASREKVLKRRITVNGNKIPLLVSPDAQLKYLKPGSNSFDQDLINIAEKYLTVSSHVWDIGANIGVFTFAAASIARKGMVVAVEADIWIASILRKTASFDEYADSHICVVPVAITNENSVTSFAIASRGRASNALEVTIRAQSQMGGIREKQFVPTLTLDRLLKSFPNPDFIKIDVEGAECMALQGATKIIKDIRPIFYIEVGELFPKILDVFHQANYQAFDPQGNPLAGNSPFNAFFVPTEKVEAYQLCN
jgi:FkbM family methyltransferase